MAYESAVRAARPTVAVGFGPRYVPVMPLAAAAADVCDLVWLVDASVPEMAERTGLLRQYGPVVDMAGLTPGDLSAAVGAHQPDGITTYVDAGMVDLAEVAAALGLPFHSPATAAALTDKALQRQVLSRAGLDVPLAVVVPDGPGTAAMATIAADVAWPAILKPRFGQGSRFTFLASDADDAARLLDGLGDDRPAMVVERYLAGDPDRPASPYADYVSVESLVSQGTIHHVAVTGRFPLAENFRETGFFIPAALGDDETRAVLEQATAAIEALGVTIGCLHTEVKFTPDGARLIEVNGRVGGGVPEMLERSSSVRLLELTLRVALGQEPVVPGPVDGGRIGYRLFLQPPGRSATVRAVEGLDAIADHPGVDAVSVHRGPGSELDWRDGSRLHIVAVVGSAGDHDELQAVEQLLRREVTVTYGEPARR